jgi:hypothetical protein
LVVLVSGHLKRLPGAEPALPKVVAHNLTREAAERLEDQLSSDSVEGQPTGWMPFLREYAEPHVETELDNCLESKEISFTALQAPAPPPTAGKSKKATEIKSSAFWEARWAADLFRPNKSSAGENQTRRLNGGAGR